MKKPLSNIYNSNTTIHYFVPSYVLVRIILLFVICFSMSVFSAKAQIDFTFQEGTFLIKGRVSDLQSHQGISKANIVILNRRTGATADADGNFKIYVFPTDTLKFTSINYISKEFPVSAIEKDSQYNVNVELMRDFIKLKDVVIYPFGNLDEFKQAFMEAKDVNKVVLPGIAPPKYSTKIPKAKFSNPISFIYDRAKKKRAADPDFRP
jgi:hypothetical protein